jgi:hypothetical protein
VLLPEGQPLLQGLALKPLPLPARIVGVLQGQLGQRGGLAGREGGVEHRDLPEEQAHRPAIRGDVVQGQQQHVLLLPQPQQAGAQHQVPRQVEGPACFLSDQAAQLRLALRFGQAAQVPHGQRHCPCGNYALDGLPGNGGKCRPQGLMPPHDLGEATPQRRHVQGTDQAESIGHVVPGAAGFQLIEEPQALLGEGQGQVAVSWGGH